MEKPFLMEIDSDIDIILEESRNSYIALRKIKWRPEWEPKLDIRKWFIDSTGREVVGKGVSFSTEKGPEKLLESLINLNIGKTDQILRTLSSREDFLDAFSKVFQVDDDGYIHIQQSETSNELVFDPKDVLL